MREPTRRSNGVDFGAPASAGSALRGRVRVAAGFAGAVGLALAGCGDNAGGSDAAPASDVQLAVVRQVSWPGGGSELTVRVEPWLTPVVLAEVPNQLEVAGEAPLEVVVAPAPQAPGFTAVLVAPVEADQRAALVAGLDALIAARPAGERIAWYRWGETIDPLGNFSADRARLRALAGRFADLVPDARPVDLVTAVAAVDAEVSAVAGRAPRVMRAVVVIGSNLGASAVPTLAPVIRADLASAPAGAAVIAAATAIDELAADHYFTVAVCGPLEGGPATLGLAGKSGAIAIGLTAALPEERDRGCDPAQIVAGARSYPSRLEFVFTPDERLVYDQRTESLSKADFALGIRWWPDTEPVRAAAHLRGAGTLGCERKNYTLDLEGPGRHLLPGSRTDEFHLLSMCADDRYVEQFTADQLMSELDLFPLGFRYVELVVDGETQGVYLLLEKAKEELVRDNARVRSVLRRGLNKPSTFYEVKYARDGANAALAGIADFLAGLDGLAGLALVAALEEHLDLDRYLRWIALMTAYQNGDYVDEVWTLSADQLAGDGSMTDWFEPMAWDNDDLFSECHYSGTLAFVDPHQLVYCAEAELDHLILADPVVYARYVEILEQLLTEQVTPTRFAAAIETTAAAILPFFERADICAAMTRFIADNPAAVDPIEARRDIRAKLDSLVASFAAQHQLLLDRIAAYRASQ